MKLLKFSVLAILGLAFLVSCDPAVAPGPDDTTPKAATYSSWWVKGSFDSWQDGGGSLTVASDATKRHFFLVDDIDSSKLTFVTPDLYAIDTKFVIVSPEGKEFVASVASVTPGTEFTIGAKDATYNKDITFTAANKAYTIVVNVSDPVSPKVNLINVDATVAMAVTNEVLLANLKIKGNQFSKIDGATVAAWTETAGTIAGSTQSWDVLVTNKTGEFGFSSLDNFLAKVDVDTAALTANGNAITSPVEILNTGGTGNNIHLTNTPKDGSVYTVSVTVDVTKAVNAGRYMMNVTLKTIGASNWAFVAWTKVYATGSYDSYGWTNTTGTTVASGSATFDITLPGAGAVGFKINKAAAWDGGEVGFSGIDATGSTVTLSDAGGNIGFTANASKSYHVTVDFTTASYTGNNKPTVTVVEF